MISEISIDFGSGYPASVLNRRQPSQQTAGCIGKINGTPGMSY